MQIHVSTKKSADKCPSYGRRQNQHIFLVLTFQMTKIWIYFICRGIIMKKSREEIKF